MQFIKSFVFAVGGAVCALFDWTMWLVLMSLEVALVNLSMIVTDPNNYSTILNPMGAANWFMLTTYFKHLWVAVLLVAVLNMFLTYRRTTIHMIPPHFKNDFERAQAFSFRARDYSKDFLSQPGFTSESLRAGSQILPNIGLVRGCLHVASDSGATVGFAQVFNGYVVMPEHVLTTAVDGFLVGPNGGSVAINPSSYELIKTDVVAMPLTDIMRRKLEVEDATVKHCFRNGSLAQLRTTPLHKDGKLVSSGHIVTGKVQPNDIFGMVSFSGSTRAGFSGAGYYVDGNLVAMHLCGGLNNLGVSAGFLSLVVEKPEAEVDSYEWLMKSADMQGGFEWDFTHDPSLVRIRDVNNRFHEVDLDFAPSEFTRKLKGYERSPGLRDADRNLYGNGYEPEAKVAYDHQIMQTGYLKDPSAVPFDVMEAAKLLKRFIEVQDVEDQDDAVEVAQAVRRSQDQAHKSLADQLRELADQLAEPAEEKDSDDVSFLEETSALVAEKKRISERLHEMNIRQMQRKEIKKARKGQSVQKKVELKRSMDEKKDLKKTVDAAALSLQTTVLRKKSADQKKKEKARQQMEDLQMQSQVLQSLLKSQDLTLAAAHQHMVDAMQNTPSTSGVVSSKGKSTKMSKKSGQE